MLLYIPVAKADDDKKIGVLVASLWGYNILILFTNSIVNLFAPNTPFDTVLCAGILFAVNAGAIMPVIYRIRISDIMFLIAIVITFLLHALIFQDKTGMIISIFPRFFLTVFPFYLVGRAIRSFDSVIEYLKPVSVFVIFAGLGYKVIMYFTSTLASDDMSFSYMLLPSVLVMLYYALNQGGLKNWLLTVIGFIVMILSGTRGPIVCVIFFLLIYLFLNLRNVKVILEYIPFFAISAFIAFSNSFIVWLKWLNTKLVQSNIDNRIIQKIIQGELSDSSGRDVIQDMVIEGIKQHPYAGNGLLADRLLTQGFRHSINGTYVHNLFLELWCQFGIIVGSIFVLVLFFIIIRKLVKSKNSYVNTFVAMLVTLSIVKLFMSGSYLNEQYLFMLIGVCVTVEKNIIRKPTSNYKIS